MLLLVLLAACTGTDCRKLCPPELGAKDGKFHRVVLDLDMQVREEPAKAPAKKACVDWVKSGAAFPAERVSRWQNSAGNYLDMLEHDGPPDLLVGCGSAGVMMIDGKNLQAVAARFPRDPRVKKWEQARVKHEEKCRAFVQQECGPVVLEPAAYVELDDACNEKRAAYADMQMKVDMDKMMKPPDMRGGIGDARIGTIDGCRWAKEAGFSWALRPKGADRCAKK